MKGTKWGYEKGFTKLVATPLTEETVTWENAKDEKLNVSHFNSWKIFPHSLSDPEKQIKADRKLKDMGSNGVPALLGQGT